MNIKSKTAIVMRTAVIMLISGFVLLMAIPGVLAQPSDAIIDVSQPTQITTSDRYERNPSVFEKDNTYWAFFVRANSTGSHDPDDGYNPDTDSYHVYYTNSTDNGVTWSSPTKVENASTGQRGMAASVDHNGKNWVFVSSPGANDIKYTTSTDNGATWSSLTDTGYEGSHVDAFEASDNNMWVFYENTTGIEAINSSDGGNSWTHVTNIGGAAADGIPKAMEADGKLYIVYCHWAVGGKVWYTNSTDGLTGQNWGAAAELVDVSGTTMCDPVMVKKGSEYVLFYAPWNQTTDAQWIEVMNTTDVTNWPSTGKRVTNGGYGTTYWWDMWPEVMVDGSDLYLFYGSEKDGAERADGDVFMFKVDWNLSNDHFEAIQPAIDAANIDNTINVAAGTYTEYLHITTDNLTVQGAGIDQSIIDLDDIVPYWHFGSSRSYASRGGVLMSGTGNTNASGCDPNKIEDVTFKGFTIKNAGVNTTIATGTHDGGDNQAVLSDSTASFPTPDGLVGNWVINVDDGNSRGQITANTATTVTATLSYGTDNDWDNGDTYVITSYKEFYDNTGDGKDDVRGMYIGGGDRIVIENVKTESNGAKGIGGSKDRGTKARGGDITLLDCISTNNYGGGVGIGAYDGLITICNGNFSNNQGRGVVVDGCGGTISITGNTISNNKDPTKPPAVGDAGDHTTGMKLKGRNDANRLSGTVSGNTISNNAYQGMNVNQWTDGITVENNVVTGHNYSYDAAGIFLEHWNNPDGCRNHLVRNNTVTGNIRGIIAYYASNSLIENNTVTTDSGTHDTGQAAIKIDHAYNITVKENKVSCDGLGIELTTSDTHDCNITENTIDGAMFAGVYIRSGAYSNTFTYNTITNTVSDTFTFWADWGEHNGSDNQAILTDSTKSWTTDVFVGMTLINIDDNSSGNITANTATTVTATLSGGTENDWDTGDDYDIVYNETQADGVFLRGGNCYAGGHAGTGNVFNYNNIYNNADDGIENQISTLIDAEYNWWGDASGPYDPYGTNETPPCTDDPVNESNIDGTGDNVSNNTDYCPWLKAPCGQPIISVDPQNTIVLPQGQFDVNITFDHNGCGIFGVQYTLHYDTDKIKAESQVTRDFFDDPSIVVINEIDNKEGTVTYAATLTGNTSCEYTAGTLTTIQFTAIGEPNATSDLTLSNVKIIDCDKQETGFSIENGTAHIYSNKRPNIECVTSTHEKNNAAKKFACDALLCVNVTNPLEEKGWNISYVRWSFGDGQYGTAEGGLPCDPSLGVCCNCKNHSYISWNYNASCLSLMPRDLHGQPHLVCYDPFNASVTVTDDGTPALSHTAFFDVWVFMAGDANGDAKVNILDAVWIGKHFNEECDGGAACCDYKWTENQPSGADLNNDCVINILDAVIVGTLWGHTAY